MKKNIIYKILAIIFMIASAIFYNVYTDDESNTNFRLEDNNGSLEIQYIDVGQADCILIRVDNEYALIDAGNNKDGKKLVNYFNELGITKFRHVFGTHAHEDHIGGMDSIIKNFKITNYYMPDVSTTTKSFEDVIDALDKNNIKYKTPTTKSTYKLGNASIKVLYVGNDSEDLNENSIILRLTYCNTSYLFTGDAPYYTENTLLDKDIESDVLKVSHHGSTYSSSNEFITKVNPKYSIISVGKNNDYNLPKEKTLNKLKSVNSKIYRTDEKGTIIVKSDGNNIKISSKKTDTNGD